LFVTAGYASANPPCGWNDACEFPQAASTKLPVGQITKTLSSASRKNIPLSLSGKSPL
jgi:hypothetical protein